jgi:transcriptional regulator with XRE-family HTH domain
LTEDGRIPRNHGEQDQQAMVVELETFGQRLRRHREEQGLNRHELALRAGVSHTHVAALENDDHSPSLNVARKLANALRIPYDDLIGARHIDQLDPEVSWMAHQIQGLNQHGRRFVLDMLERAKIVSAVQGNLRSDMLEIIGKMNQMSEDDLQFVMRAVELSFTDAMNGASERTA